jgi:hypothetical protein
MEIREFKKKKKFQRVVSQKEENPLDQDHQKQKIGNNQNIKFVSLDGATLEDLCPKVEMCKKKNC